MKRAIFAFVLAFVLAAPAYSAFPEYDGGPILSVGEDYIEIQGEKGRYIVEPLGICSWCQVGIHAILRFRGFTQATLKPKEDFGDVRPIRVLILHDTRNE
jgi:hypothetical protein